MCVACAYATLTAGVELVLNDVDVCTRDSVPGILYPEFRTVEFRTRNFVPKILYPNIFPRGGGRWVFRRVEFCTLARGFYVEFCTLLLSHKTRRWRV